VDCPGEDDGDGDGERDGQRLRHDEHARHESERGDAADEQPGAGKNPMARSRATPSCPSVPGMRRRVKKRNAPTNDANRDGADIALRS